MTYSLKRRPAVAADAQSVASWFPTKSEVILWAGPTAPESLTPEWLIQQFQATGYYSVWVDSFDRVQGVFALNIKGGGCARFGRFALSPDFRGRGLAKKLVEEVVSVARFRGVKQLSLGVYGSNHVAKHVYESCGFEVFEERPCEEDSSGINYQMKLNL
jgi:ribosomal protein S18 acetylase RimI-like enzyme